MRGFVYIMKGAVRLNADYLQKKSNWLRKMHFEIKHRLIYHYPSTFLYSRAF